MPSGASSISGSAQESRSQAGQGTILTEMTAPTEDVFRRPLRDLRVSVTDRCNFRCVYCMPKEIFGKEYAFLPQDQVLSFEEIARIVRITVGLGVEKVRLTGGEPLVRRDIERLVAMLAPIGAMDLTLTTNGSLLATKAKALAEAGLKRVTVSLDSLDDETFKRMNDVGFPVQRVLDGIAAAERAGLAPIKVNMVVRRGLNETSVLPMARHFRGTGHVLRFIEYMDVGTSNGWRLDDVVPARELVETIDREFPARAGRAGVPRRGRGPVPLQGRCRRDRRHHLGHAAVLRRLHPRASFGGRLAVHLPLRDGGPRPEEAPPRRRERR
jgi:GTP 3',8-cyclase